MDASTSFKQIERRAYLSLFEDGLWDILLGLFLAGWGLALRLDMAWLTGAFFVILYPAVLGLKRSLTYPRSGYVRIAGAQRQKMKMVVLGLVLFFAGLAALLLVWAGEIPAWLREYFMFFFAVMLALVIVALGYWWRVYRWFLYAVLLVASSAFYQWGGTPLEYSFIIPGTVIILVGVYLLARFLQKYPRPAGGNGL